ncbi:hypothetical protein K443DRAFT_15119 [Laccaria amethystina LaAM-08-1]|uniref:Uncharacterized protein n=1 Tax=Laccaria amethystina LaAM-08-1 TaxID=1095629 RepID=A0A0C9WRP8_9AGAR|nr:hypothetical protein K443DRAFT_15119 [Laccaria amethystina LaAM-08-1]
MLNQLSHKSFIIYMTSANPDARFGVTNNANLLLPTTTIHDNHPPPPPTTNTPTPPPSTTPSATTTATATVVVLHKPHHHQTADVARQRFIRACHIDGDSQDAERDPATPNFEDHATKERGKGATGGQGNKGPAATRTTPIPLPEDPTTTTPPSANGNDHGQRQPPTEDEHARTAATPPPLPEDDDPLHGWTTSPTPWTDGNHLRTTIPNHHDPPPPAPATPYGRPHS